MNKEELHNKLRNLNEFELQLQNLLKNKYQSEYKLQLKHFFSKNNNDSKWIINSDKLIMGTQLLAIHKHDRFIKFYKHKHDYLELIFVYSGKIRQKIEDDKVIIKQGEIIILDMNVEHSIDIAYEHDIAINILIKKEFFDWIFLSQIAYNDIISDFIVKALYEKKKFKQYLHFQTSNNNKIKDIIENILYEYYEPKVGTEIAIRAFMNLLFNELLRHYKKQFNNDFAHRVEKSILLDIMNYINDNYKKNNIKDIAKYFNFNPDYMGKIIKKITGKSYKTLIKEKRFQQAEYLLKNTNLSVSDIVNEVGYSNISYFYKQFKAYLGITPDEYRNRKE
ncbi:helix-turn-helix domain-containing protein [Vallitalea sediminicola]